MHDTLQETQPPVFEGTVRKIWTLFPSVWSWVQVVFIALWLCSHQQISANYCSVQRIKSVLSFSHLGARETTTAWVMGQTITCDVLDECQHCRARKWLMWPAALCTALRALTQVILCQNGQSSQWRIGSIGYCSMCGVRVLEQWLYRWVVYLRGQQW